MKHVLPRKDSPENMPLKRILKLRELYQTISKYVWVLLVIGIVVSGWASFTFPMHQDEKVFIDVARVIVQGGAPYRDYLDNKPPGIYLLLALFVAIFGENLMLLRLIPFVLNLGIGWLLYDICRTIYNAREGVVFASLYLFVSPFYQSNFILTEVPMTFCLLAGTRLVWKCCSSGRSREALWAGFWIGMAVLFKQPALVYACAVIILMLLRSIQLDSVKKTMFLLGLYLFGILTPITATIFYLKSYNILAYAFQQIIDNNIHTYEPERLTITVNKIPQLIAPMVILWVLRVLLIPKSKLKPFYLNYISIFILISIPFLLFRPYHHYWIPILPYILLIL